QLLAAIFGCPEYREPVGQIIKKAEFRHEYRIGRSGTCAVPSAKFADCRLQMFGHAPFCKIGRAQDIAASHKAEDRADLVSRDLGVTRAAICQSSTSP